MLNFASAADIVDAVNSYDAVVVDIRPMAAYNGWPLNSEARGGHIPGSVPFPASWISESYGDQRAHLLQNKGIVQDKNLILYGYGLDDARAAASSLARLGYPSVRIFKDGLTAWAADANNPMERLPNYRHLVHPEWLAGLLRGEECFSYEGGPFVLAHTSFDNRDDYNSGHIAGAIPLDTLFLEEPEHWNRRNPDDLEKALLSNGITCDTTVVLCGRTGNPSMRDPHPGRYAGQIAAMRAALLLMYAGVRDVRVMDGGLNAWLSAGFELTSEAVVPTPVEKFGCRVPAHPEYVIDLAAAKDYLADPMSELVCMRSWPEFIGEQSGYHYIGPRGRIPGAVFGNCGSDAYHMQNYRNPDNTMLNYREIASNWLEVGVIPEKRLAFYCGTGWRASEAFFYAWLMGWERVAVYDGGWYEWSIDEGNPVETGVPEGTFIRTRRY